ncbi:hypothetical protein FPANT_2243 [Fusarium pseudoanthophilum]|uniref:Uncharacterized protein n=1 Tax=Fusarium pseudoanthophilum TaxID=48495 RepID=A0A8H5PNV0_9HYPO|nr:hypothetical protein FPANT_2243 [Fusarium pseudoanthophilum]
MEMEVNGAQIVMGDATWNFAINYVGENKTTSTSEAVCNGIWNEILQRNFPYPKFIIAPEQRQTTAIRPDLTIFFVDKTKKEWHPVFTFEGKAPYHEKYMVEKGKDQATKYIVSLSWSADKWVNENKKETYGMLACGKSFMILKYDVGTKDICRIDPKSRKTSTDFTPSSLDGCAEDFDAICKNIADSFLV